MSPDASAILALLVYAVVAVGVLAVQFRRSRMRFPTWFLYGVERLYMPFGYHWRANRRCPFPESGPAIIVANHRCGVDPLFIWMNNHLGWRKRRPRVIAFMTAREFSEIRGLKWVCRAAECIPVERHGRDMRAAHEALERLKQGRMVGIFPEGGINTGEGLREGDTGIAWLALHAEVPVYPVYIHNAPQSDSMLRPFFTLSRVRLTYGDAIDLSVYSGRKRVTRGLLTEVTDLLMTRLAELGGVEYRKEARAPAAQAGEESPRALRLVRPA
jgi:1-acyl-sn-glycerol-3-phosphate acyltransferase